MADQPKKKPVSNKNMNTDRPNRKAFKQDPNAFRGQREWRGSKTRKTRVDDVQKVLLGGGMYRNVGRTHEGSVRGAWKFGGLSYPLFDAKQVEENKRLYPHLFTDK